MWQHSLNEKFTSAAHSNLSALYPGMQYADIHFVFVFKLASLEAVLLKGLRSGRVMQQDSGILQASHILTHPDPEELGSLPYPGLRKANMFSEQAAG